MNQIQRKSPFWSLAGPLFSYLAIQWIVQLIIMLVICLPHMAGAYADLMQSQAGAEQLLGMQEIMETYTAAMEPAFEVVVQYQVEIAGAAALGTLILTGILFAKDRKLEKACGIAVAEKKDIFSYILIFILGVAGCIAATCLMTMAQLALYDSQYQQTVQTLYAAGFPMQVAVLGILIPVSEEMMFRGILFKRFRERQGFWYSAVCSSIFFAFMHMNVTQTIYAFLLGLMLSYFYEKTGSFKAPVLLHIVMNTGSVIFTELGVFWWLGADPVRMAGAAIGGAFICSVVFVSIQRKLGTGPEKIPPEPQDPMNMFR